MHSAPQTLARGCWNFVHICLNTSTLRSVRPVKDRNVATLTRCICAPSGPIEVCWPFISYCTCFWSYHTTFIFALNNSSCTASLSIKIPFLSVSSNFLASYHSIIYSYKAISWLNPTVFPLILNFGDIYHLTLTIDPANVRLSKSLTQFIFLTLDKSRRKLSVSSLWRPAFWSYPGQYVDEKFVISISDDIEGEQP